MNGIVDGLRALGPARLIGLAVAAVMTVAALLTLTSFSGGEPMTLLYGELDLSESAQIVGTSKSSRSPISSAAAAVKSWSRPTVLPVPASSSPATPCPPEASSATKSSIAVPGWLPASSSSA